MGKGRIAYLEEGEEKGGERGRKGVKEEDKRGENGNEGEKVR